MIAPKNSELSMSVEEYFDRLWSNEDGLFTSNYDTNENMLTPMLTYTYKLQKLTGLTTY